MTSITDPNGIEYFRLSSLKGAVKLESLGMKRRGTSATSIARKELGLKARATHAEVIAAIQSKMNAMMTGSPQRAVANA